MVYFIIIIIILFFVCYVFRRRSECWSEGCEGERDGRGVGDGGKGRNGGLEVDCRCCAV